MSKEVETILLPMHCDTARAWPVADLNAGPKASRKIGSRRRAGTTAAGEGGGGSLNRCTATITLATAAAGASPVACFLPSCLC